MVTDPLCKPFSMGRNLFCVHSRKRLDDIPELKAAKVQQNRRTLIAMGTKFLQVCTETSLIGYIRAILLMHRSWSWHSLRPNL